MIKPEVRQRLEGRSLCFVFHPYTSRTDIGAGGDRYSGILLDYYTRWVGTPARFEAGVHRTFLSAVAAEIPFALRAVASRHDLYHATTSASGAAILRLRKGPVVTTVHDLIAWLADERNDRAWKFYYKKKAIKYAATRSDRVIVPFPSTKTKLHELFGVPLDRIDVVPYGIDHSQFTPLDRKPSNRPRVVLFVGALTKGKGVDSLIRAWDLVRDRVKDVELHLGSEGWDTEFMQKLVRGCRHRDSIRMIGFIPEDRLRETYASADVCVFPSRYGFGLPLLEAMACGTATVSGRTLDAPEFVGDAGLLACPDSVEEIATAIVRLLDDETVRKDFEKRGVARARQFSWENTAARTFEVYARIG